MSRILSADRVRGLRHVEALYEAEGRLGVWAKCMDLNESYISGDEALDRGCVLRGSLDEMLDTFAALALFKGAEPTSAFDIFCYLRTAKVRTGRPYECDGWYLATARALVAWFQPRRVAYGGVKLWESRRRPGHFALDVFTPQHQPPARALYAAQTTLADFFVRTELCVPETAPEQLRHAVLVQAGAVSPAS